ncbi:MAG: arylsulfatase A-like enzyme [Gammaproteobacteria bacterium]|jgi:arylsulfatase A-like enzyme
MPKRSLTILLVLCLVGGTAAWLKRVDILLAFVKYKSQNDYIVAPNRELPWQQGPESAVAENGERPPNIIVILADDLGMNDISTFGGGVAGGRVTTPNIDRLATQGAVFNQAYAGNATCAPSRAMILTGRYAARTGFEFTPTPSGMGPMVSMVANSLDSGLPPGIFNESDDTAAVPYEQQGLPSAEVTIAEVLKKKGYYTAHIGKWHLGRGEGLTPNDQGFDDSLLMASALYLPENDPNVVNAKVEFDPIDKFLWARLGYANSFNNGGEERFEPGGYLTDYWTDESIKIIKANKNRPFFLYLAHWGVHTPLQATREDYDAVGDIKPHRLRVYAAMIRALDRSVGRITETLEAEGLADNTIVMFTSDNGGAGYIGLEDINAPYRGWKLTMFEGGIRAPMFMKWPAKIAAGTRVNEPVAHIDMMPTLTAAAQATLPADVVIDGVNLLPMATGEVQGLPRETLFWQSGYYRVVRHGDWKLQVSERPKKTWLYNLAADPSEQNNLAETNADKHKELMALLAAHKASARKPLYPYTIEMPVALDKSLGKRFESGDEFIFWPN